MKYIHFTLFTCFSITSAIYGMTDDLNLLPEGNVIEPSIQISREYATFSGFLKNIIKKTPNVINISIDNISENTLKNIVVCLAYIADEQPVELETFINQLNPQVLAYLLIAAGHFDIPQLRTQCSKRWAIINDNKNIIDLLILNPIAPIKTVDLLGCTDNTTLTALNQNLSVVIFTDCLNINTLANNNDLTSIKQHTKTTSICFSPDEKFVLTSLYNGDIVIYNCNDLGELTHFQTITFGIYSTIFSLRLNRDSSSLVCCDDNDFIIILQRDLNTNQFKLVQKIDTDRQGYDQIHSLNYSQNGNFIVMGTNGTLAIWKFDDNTAQFEHFQDIKFRRCWSVTSICFSPDCQSIIAGLDNGDIMVLQLDNTTNEFKYIQELKQEGEVCSLSFNQNNNYLVSSSKNHIKIWSKNAHNLFSLIHTFKSDAHNINLAYCNENNYLIVSTLDEEKISIWNMQEIRNFYEPF